MFEERRTSVHRERRLPDDYRAIIDNPLMRPCTVALLLKLLDMPPHWQISVTHIVKMKRYGGRDAVRRMFQEMMLAGYMIIDPQRRPDGTFERGIYLVASEPRWAGAVDNLDGDEMADFGRIGVSQASEPPLENQSPGINNSIVNPDTDTRGHVENMPIGQHSKADARQCGRKSSLTNQSERAIPPAKSHPTAERRSRDANGSAVKGGRAEKSVEIPSPVRDIERLRSRLIAAGGKALADPRTTPGLWKLTEVIVWVTLGFDLEADILPTIRDVSTRFGIESRQVRSWRYYSAAIRDAHARRKGLAVPRKQPRIDPYSGPPKSEGDLMPVGNVMEQVFLAAALRRR